MKLQVKVIPSSSKDCIAGWLDHALKIKVKAPPDKGKANKAIINVLEKSLSLPKGCISIESGLTSCKKIIEINVDNDNNITNKLEQILKK